MLLNKLSTLLEFDRARSASSARTSFSLLVAFFSQSNRWRELRLVLITFQQTMQQKIWIATNGEVKWL
jgi:hypothetical protein